MMKSYFFLIVLGLFSYYKGTTQNVNIHYLGHSAFVLTFDDITIVTDYGKPNAWKEWGWDSPIHSIDKLVPDIMTYSHLHDDHYDSTRIPKGVKHILKAGESLNYYKLDIKTIQSCEDQFGEFNNNSYLFTYKGVTVLHTGDIQSMIANIKNETIANYFKENFPKQIDLLIMPIEGKIKYIEQTYHFIQVLNPKCIIPTHYWSQQYLEQFIDFIKKKNDSSLKYNLDIRVVPIFNMTKSISENLINIVILNPEPFVQDK